MLLEIRRAGLAFFELLNGREVDRTETLDAAECRSELLFPDFSACIRCEASLLQHFECKAGLDKLFKQ